MKVHILFFVLIIYSFGQISCASKTQSIGTTNAETVAQDAAWCWFSDPRAIYHKGAKEAVYFGYINMKGDVMVRSLDLKTNKMQEFNLHPQLQIDDHNVPSFLFLPDGNILAL